MLRGLFLSEFKRIAWPSIRIAAVTVALVFATNVGAKRFGGFGTLDSTAWIAWPATFIFMFAMGAANIARIKEHYLPFVLSLPATRSKIWLTLTVAQFAATLVMPGVVFAALPSIIAGSPTFSAFVAIFGVSVFLYFAAAVAALVFKNGASVGAAAIIQIVAQGFIWLSAASFLSSGVMRSVRIFVVSEALSVVLLLAVSIICFRRGEFDRWKTLATNCVLLLIAMAGVWPLLSFAAGTPIFLSDRQWSDEVQVASVSYDGRYLAIMRRHSAYLYYARIDIVDLVSNALAGSFAREDIRSEVLWSKSADVLNIAAHHSISGLPYLTYAASILRLSPQGQILEVLPSTAEMNSGIASWKGTLLMRADGNHLLLSGVDGDQFILPDNKGGFTGSSAAGPSVVAFADDGRKAIINARERGSLQVLGADSKWAFTGNVPQYFIGDAAYSDRAQAAAALASKLAAPATASPDVAGAFLYQVRWVSGGALPRFYIRADGKTKKGELLHNSADQTWKVIAGNIPLDQTELDAVAAGGSIVEVRTIRSISVHPSQRFAAFTANGTDVSIYDVATDSVIPLGTVEALTAGRRLEMEDIPSGDPGFVISVRPITAIAGPPHVGSALLYFPEAKMAHETRLAGYPVLYATRDGSHIDLYGDEVLQVKPSGETRRLWPR